jgi:hypothetical protein
MRDRLERLEKLGYLVVDDWLRWRELIAAYARWKRMLGTA